VFPLRKFYTEQIFVLVRMQLRNYRHTTSVATARVLLLDLGLFCLSGVLGFLLKIWGFLTLVKFL